MRKHRRTGYVTDGIDALRSGLHALVDLDESAISSLNALLLEPDVFYVGSASCRDENLLDFEKAFIAWLELKLGSMWASLRA